MNHIGVIFNLFISNESFSPVDSLSRTSHAGHFIKSLPKVKFEAHLNRLVSFSRFTIIALRFCVRMLIKNFHLQSRPAREFQENSWRLCKFSGDDSVEKLNTEESISSNGGSGLVKNYLQFCRSLFSPFSPSTE